MPSRLLSLLPILLPMSAAHSWVDRASVASTDGRPIGSPGYMRSYYPRSMSSVDINDLDTYILPPNDGRTPPNVISTDPVCKNIQSSYLYPSAPVLSAPAGSRIMLEYNENGHITIPQNNPPGKASAGEVYIYGVPYEATANDFLLDVIKWNGDGTNNARHGRLLNATSFDDGWCYQYSNSAIAVEREALGTVPDDPTDGKDVYCNAYFELPGDLPKTSIYTIYWVWNWPTSRIGPTMPVKEQIYTSCLDIVIS